MRLRLRRLIRGLRLDKSLPKLWRCFLNFHDWHRLFATYAGLRAFFPGEQFKIRGRIGLTITVYEPVDIITVFNVFCNPDYLVLPTDSLIIDIGANIGAFTIYAAVHAPNAYIIAYEPVRYVFNHLVQQCNQEYLKNRVELVQCAVGNDGQRQIFVGWNDAISSLVPKTSYRWVEDVCVCSIHSVIQQAIRKRERISLMKIDCEGCEWEILTSLTKELAGKIDRICLEYHPIEGYDKQFLVSRLKSLGFSVLRLIEFGADEPGIGWFVRQS